ncbi:MAG: hypothetical protein LQ351_003345 [Letrouitia transgressa]|nr:MAG: hypothetical protein LQ351_003345 [Letrouitia transgressa]
MDPLSISASIAGLCIAAAQVSYLLRDFIGNAKQAPSTARHTLMEVTGISICLTQLDSYLSGRQEAARSRRMMIMVEQVIIILTNCVSIFSELEQVLEALKTDGVVRRVIDRVKWSLKERTLSDLLSRLQASKTSLSLMLNILTWRLNELEKMHPALGLSAYPSNASSAIEFDLIQGTIETPAGEVNFEKDLEISPVYRRAGFIALPISSQELWNHHRYQVVRTDNAKADIRTLDAWYNPPPTKSAFIRTAYFNGQYTNQYAQNKFRGHLIYCRFIIDAPNSQPIFTDGAVLPRIEEGTQSDHYAPNTEIAEIQDTDRWSEKTRSGLFGAFCMDDPLANSSVDCSDRKPLGAESSSKWGQMVNDLLRAVQY